MADCAYHQGREPVGGCSNCGKLICAECKVTLAGRVYCNPCADALVTGSAVSKNLGWSGEPSDEALRPHHAYEEPKGRSHTFKIGMGILAIVVVAIAVALVARSGSANIAKPSVTVVPQGWYLSADHRYGHFQEVDGTRWGLVEYTDDITYDFVQIFYGDVPRELSNRGSDPDALTERARWEASGVHDVEEEFMMTISGRLAACVREYDSFWGYHEMTIVFVFESTCIHIYSIYDPTEESEENVMSLIESITFDN